MVELDRQPDSRQRSREPLGWLEQAYGLVTMMSSNQSLSRHLVLEFTVISKNTQGHLNTLFPVVTRRLSLSLRVTTGVWGVGVGGGVWVVAAMNLTLLANHGVPGPG